VSITSIIWVLLAVTFLVMSLRRPVWAVAFYLQTFFAAPHMWWWGDEIPSARYALWAGVALLVAVVVSPETSTPNVPGFKRMRAVAIALAANATVVHLLLAVDRSISIDTYDELLKYILLFFIMSAAIKDRSDFHRVVATMAIGAAYIGWEVTINERGDFSGSRLEGVGAPAAQTANSLANVMLVVLPLAGSLFIARSWKWKIVSLVAAPLVLNVLLLCNSRGAFLGLVGTGVAMVTLARGQTRKRALQVLALASVALFFLLGDPEILDRFVTTFVGSEARDNSANSRFMFWNAGMALLNDYPLGAGGGAFKFSLGQRYLGSLLGVEDAESRSLHNGYLTEATDWGVQGLLLKVSLFIVGIMTAYRTCEKCRKEGRTQDALLGLCVVTTAVGFLIHCFFGSFLNNEWGFWTLALLARYAALYSEAEAVPAESRPDVSARPAAAA
jgi:putative inorganic carbon (hco3(-)) transporter